MTPGRRLVVLAVAPIVAVGLAGCGGGGGAGGPGTVRVAAASSLAEVVDGLAGVLGDAEDPVAVEADLAGSSTLATQLLEGSPADVFLSADAETMARVVEGGVAAGDPVAFATNGLVLAVPAGNPGGVTGLADLADPDLLVGLCAPEVPCGRLARAELGEDDVAVRPDTEEPDVRSLLAKVAAGELDVGLVYATDVVAAGDDVEVVEEPRLDQRTTYLAVAVEGGDPEAAGALLDVLRGPTGATLLAALGFGPR